MPGLTIPPVGAMPPSSMNNSMNASAPISSNNSNTANNNNNSNNNMNNSIQSAGNGTSTQNLSAGPFRPKPIEELLMPQHDKPTKGTPPPSLPPLSSALTTPTSSSVPQQMPMSEQKSNMSSAFNKSMDPNIKNLAR